MKLVIVLVACAAYVAGQAATDLELLRFYHKRIGVALAERLRLAEFKLIVRGANATSGAYPYLGGLLITLTTGETSVCGSSLLSHTRAVTAAHCWWDGQSQARQFTVVLGSTRLYTGGTRIDTTSVEMHANWNPSNLSNDIAIINLPQVTYTELIMPVALPSGSLLNDTFAGQWATASGYGMTSNKDNTNELLNHVSLRVITNAQCQQAYRDIIITSTLCTSGAGGRGICGEDSGGPLVITSGKQPAVLIGITSFGLAWSCGSGHPDGFTRVTSFNDWIRAHL